MGIYDFIITHIVPLIAANPSQEALNMVEFVFWLFMAYFIAYTLVYLPYRFIRWVGRFPSPFGRR